MGSTKTKALIPCVPLMFLKETCACTVCVCLCVTGNVFIIFYVQASVFEDRNQQPELSRSGLKEIQVHSFMLFEHSLGVLDSRLDLMTLVLCLCSL